MANVRLMGKHWELVAIAIKTEMLRQTYLITKTRHQILKLPIKCVHHGISLEDQVAELKKTIIADCEFKSVHPDAEVQGNLNLNQLEDLRQQLFALENRIADINRVIDKYKDILYFVETASKKPDTVFDKDVHIPGEKIPFTGDWGIFTEEEKETWDKID